jgi:PBP1b-binding outer membrane lipoprotein LpoB
MARQKVELNSAGVRALLNDAGVRAFVASRADAVAAAARSSAPRVTGEYAASIHRESVTTDRAVERVVADAPHALGVEARTGNLARAMSAGGG